MKKETDYDTVLKKGDQQVKDPRVMTKFKLESEFDKHLLRDHPSKRPREDEPGFKLVTVPPKFSTNPDNKWTTISFDYHLQGWKKLCVEAYCSGWLAFYDFVLHKEHNLDHSIYFNWKDDDHKKDSDGKGESLLADSEVTIFIDPGPIQTAGIVNAVPPAEPPKPPPPPMS